jgi:hypothetical protein
MLKTLVGRLTKQMRDRAGAVERPAQPDRDDSGASPGKASTHQAKLKIITAFDQGFAQIGAIAAASIARYASVHEFDYEIFRDVSVGRPPAWAKIHYLIAEIRSAKYDYVLWVDADACFVRTDQNILDQASAGKDLWMANLVCLREPLVDHPGVYLACDRPNTGVLLVKATAWSLEFLEQVWAQEDCIHSHWWENAAVHKLMGYWYEISAGQHKNELIDEVISHIGWLDSIWNSVPTPANGVAGLPGVINSPDPVIVHFAGMRNDLRLKEMQALARRPM